MRASPDIVERMRLLMSAEAAERNARDAKDIARAALDNALVSEFGSARMSMFACMSRHSVFHVFAGKIGRGTCIFCGAGEDWD